VSRYPFSDEVRRVLQHAAEESDRLLHNYIGTEHLLLGLLHEEGSAAVSMLHGRGLRLDAVRNQIVELLSRGERREPPGPPPLPANAYTLPWPRYVPSRTVHILYSDLQPPQQPMVNYAGDLVQACGFTLTEAIVKFWRGNRWHVDSPDSLDDQRRYDFFLQLPQQEPFDEFLRLLRDSVEQQFGVQVGQQSVPRDVFVVRKAANDDGEPPMLRYYGEPEPGSGFAMAGFFAMTGRPHAAPSFPLGPFAIHSVPFAILVHCLEDLVGGELVDETDLGGLYGLVLDRTVNSREEFIDVLRTRAGLQIVRERRDTPTLVVRRRRTAASGSDVRLVAAFQLAHQVELRRVGDRHHGHHAGLHRIADDEIGGIGNAAGHVQ
jgi:uncharacterized protein (TIGR03435 family)